MFYCHVHVNVVCGKKKPMSLASVYVLWPSAVCVARTEGNGAVIKVGSIQCISDLDIILLAIT